jgi:hypothetical protein
MLIKVSLIQLIILLIILCVIVYITIRWRRISSRSYFDIDKSLPVFQKYLDSYYIANKSYTLAASLFFLFSNIIIFILLRYMSLGEISKLIPLELNDIFFLSMISLALQYILFVLCIFVYKIILEIFLLKEVLKCHLYLMQYDLYISLQSIMIFKVNDYILGRLWMICYRIATGTYYPELFSKDFDIWFPQMIHSLEHNYIVTNHYLKKIALWFMQLSSKWFVISYFFYLLARILKFLWWHNKHDLFKLTPYVIIITTLFYDLYNKELYYIYYISFIFLFVHLFISYRNFVRGSKMTSHSIIADYFYKNTLPYEMQRFYVLNHENYSLGRTSTENDMLKIVQQDSWMLFYNLKNTVKEKSEEEKLTNKRILYMYFRFYIFLVFSIFSFFLLTYNNLVIDVLNLRISLLFLFMPMLFLLYNMKKIFYRKSENEYTGDEFYEHVYSRNHNILFWIATVVQGYLFWLLVFLNVQCI